MEPLKPYLNTILPLCPRCNHRHQLQKETNYKTEKCPYCNCKMQYNKATKEYEPKPIFF
jgi:transcription initiation factor IIE alpha subunit